MILAGAMTAGLVLIKINIGIFASLAVALGHFGLEQVTEPLIILNYAFRPLDGTDEG
jgi:hypothetical protein